MVTTNPASLFIQVSSYGTVQLKAALDHVYTQHRNEMGVILNEIGAGSGLHTDKLDLIRRYLPSGTHAAFTHVFVGSHFEKWDGDGTAYREGMLDLGHRWKNLRTQERLWSLFKERYPFINPGLYIDHEGVLDLFDEWDLRAAYTAYLIQSVKDAHDVIPNVSVLWSPAIWSGVELTENEELAIARAFTDVKLHVGKYGHQGGITHLYLQDMMGRSRSDITRADVKQWYLELKKAHESSRLFDDLGINMELFIREDGGLIAQPVQMVTDRTRWYLNEGVPIRAGWELRYWIDTHVHPKPLPVTARDQVVEILQVATDQILKALDEPAE